MKTKRTFKTKLYSIIFGLSMVFGFTVSFAQDQDTGGATGGGIMGGDLAIGAKVGANFNQFTQPGTSAGFSAGGYARYQILDFLEVQGEIAYSLQGGARREFTRDFSGLPGSGSVGVIDGPISAVQYINRNIVLSNIEVPISARLTLPELNGGAMVPKFIVGGSYSYNFAAFELNDQMYYFNDGTQFLLSDRQENVTSDYYHHNLSGHVGFALDFNLENDKVFTMEFKYRQGFTNLNAIYLGLPELTERLRSSGFSVNFSYRIL